MGGQPANAPFSLWLRRYDVTRVPLERFGPPADVLFARLIDLHNSIMEERAKWLEEARRSVKTYLKDPHNNPLPEHLALAWRCERFHCLLVEGGYYDQPDADMMLIEAALAAQAEYEREQEEQRIAKEISRKQIEFLRSIREGEYGTGTSEPTI